MHTIYVIQNLDNLKIYVGQSIDANKRWKGHCYYAQAGFHHPLYVSMRKYGIENFEFTILESYDSLDDTNDAEKFWISFFRSWDRSHGYNIDHGGSRQTDDVRNKISRAAKRRSVIPTTTTRAKMSASHTGKKFSEETRKKMSTAQTGIHDRSGEKNGRSKLTREIVQQIRELARLGKRRIEIQRELNLEHVGLPTIGAVMRGRTWAEELH